MTDEFYQMVKGVSEAASQPLCKLIDAISSGAGLVYEPIHIRRKASAEADALLVREKTDLMLSELRQRAVARLTNTETRRQHNIESIVENATENLPDKCSDEPVDQDWIADFFDCCKDVGNEQVQSLWGKLLAGEISEPGSYSRRALNTLKLMSSYEAALFSIIGFRVWKLDGWPVLLIPGDRIDEWPATCPFRWRDVLSLAEISLTEKRILDEDALMGTDRGEVAWDYHGRRFVRSTNPTICTIPGWVNFSSLGAELLPLVEKEAGIRDDYFEACCQSFDTGTWQVDETSDFRELIVPDEVRESLNLNTPTPDTETDE